VIIGNLELAINNLSRGMVVRENLDEAMNAGRRASKVTGMMLTYLGHVPGELEPIDLSAACRETLATLPCPLIARAEFSMDLPSPGPIIKANRGQVQQALSNLLTNACEAIGEGHDAIRLNVKTVSKTEIPAKHRFPVNWKPKGDRYACVEVVDTGSGIAAKDLEKLCDPFYSSKFTGRGLGLPVALGIVRASHGVITVESQEGAGSVFRIFLPLSNEPVSHSLENMTKADENGAFRQALGTAQSRASRESASVARS
jgi:signal transduction histidine kinase